jgi:hypothetical protein
LLHFYWYRGVTVLLLGWVIWMQVWAVHANLPLGWLALSALSVPIRAKGKIPLLTLTQNTISSILLQN